jgi:hypothetical protein
VFLAHAPVSHGSLTKSAETLQYVGNEGAKFASKWRKFFLHTFAM